MKTIGLIGGMSWESTSTYYSLINRGINQHLGGNSSASCLIYSFNFQEIQDLQYAGDWKELKERIFTAARQLKAAGAELLILCTNTMHKVVEGIENEVGLPFLHIADAIGADISKDNHKTVGLLGTIFTMEQPFYKERLIKKYKINAITPTKEDMQIINTIIYNELVKGIIRQESRNEYLRIMNDLHEKGAEGIILGCTEIGLLINEFKIPLYDSTIIHAKATVELSLK